MSASTQQQGQTGPIPTNGNGQKLPRKARGPNKKKAAVRVAAPLQAGQQPPGVTGAGQTVVAARRIGPAPVAAAPTITTPIAQGSLAWLYARQQEIEIEQRVIRGMIASFGPRKLATTGTAPTKRKKKAKKRAAPVRNAA